ncbi:hypothetical protein K440DRAFT_372132 [Wilcoxina mikolae CBS 423.85]|nr:hypothetical protein K440DRAFT_372132 [Wilcoxina mikolae CBS 423.85]
MSTITFNYADKRMWIFIAAFILNACLFAFGVITWKSTTSLHLPLPILLPILATFLPVLNLGGTIHALSKPTSKVVARPLRSGFPAILLLIFDTFLLAVASSKSRNSLCEFHDKWQEMFRSHDAKAIEGIQNALSCCGFKTPQDMPFPFPAQGVGVNTCRQQTGRKVGCADAIEEVEESDGDGDGDAEGVPVGRNGSPQPSETTPLMLEGSSPWHSEGGVNGAGRGEREREQERAGREEL